MDHMDPTEKELKKTIEERDAARRHASRLKGMLAGAYSLLAKHGIELELSEFHE